MPIKRLHFISGIIISVFTGCHLFNHTYSIFGVDKHIELMNTLRLVYRNIFIEFILIAAVVVQIISGLQLLKGIGKAPTSVFARLQVWTGLYLAFFFVFHLTAVFGGRFLLHLDTNFYFGAAGLNVFPFNLFFIPYYGLAIISVFGHLASVHSKKMKQTFFGLTPSRQAYAILLIGCCVTGIIFYGLTNRFRGFKMPQEYNILIGK